MKSLRDSGAETLKGAIEMLTGLLGYINALLGFIWSD